MKFNILKSVAEINFFFISVEDDFGYYRHCRKDNMNIIYYKSVREAIQYIRNLYPKACKTKKSYLSEYSLKT